MQYENYEEVKLSVPKGYEEVFTHFYFAKNKSDEVIIKTLLPSYQSILIFNLGQNPPVFLNPKTPTVIDKCTVLGPIKKAFQYALPSQSEILVANFKDDAFYRFFGTTPAIHLPLNPDRLLEDTCFEDVWNELILMKDQHQRLKHLLNFCEPYLKQRHIVAQQLANFNHQNYNPIKFIAETQRQSERNIQILHKKYFGYSAKEASRHQRFLQVLACLQTLVINRKKVDWFEIIHQCGYYDQSQLIQDFKHFTGFSPTKYLKSLKDICNPVN
ncbi:MAG TPA: AraC family transcriptional regulator [Microscillaceae bacterium]|nr:AraC family transcriptional regulator [Microscillaceae bacterium]